MNCSHFTFSLSCFAFKVNMFCSTKCLSLQLPQKQTNIVLTRHGKNQIKALCFSIVKQRQREQKEKQTTCLLACTHTYIYICIAQYILIKLCLISYTHEERNDYRDTELVQVLCQLTELCFVFVPSRVNRLWLGQNWFVGLRPCLFLFFFVCQEIFEIFFLMFLRKACKK